jgi:hypothetical protein
VVVGFSGQLSKSFGSWTDRLRVDNPWTVDPADTRAKRLRVTDTGADLAPRAIAAIEQVDTRFFQPVPLDDAVALLDRLAHPEGLREPTA